MPFSIIRNDIVRVRADAIVNAAAPDLLGGGGVDGAIHRAAGPGLLAECRTLGGCRTGDAKLTKAYDLPAKYVIHTVGPIWQDGSHGERALLASCYRRSLELALQAGCKSVAFPLISSGAFGYPPDQAMEVAVETIGGFLLQQELDVTLVLFDDATLRAGKARFAQIQAYIDDRYAAEHCEPNAQRRRRLFAAKSMARDPGEIPMEACLAAPCAPAPDDLEHILREADAGFSETLLKLIDRTGKKDSEIYKRANVDRKLFSKIRGNPDYRPSKSTALAFAIALELDLGETRDFLARAGYALSPSFKSDLIIEYFIKQGNYDIFQINEALFAFDQSLLGA